MEQFGKRLDIERQIKGKTGFVPEYEEELFDLIAETENGESNIPKMGKIDWIFIGILAIVFITIPVILAITA